MKLTIAATFIAASASAPSISASGVAASILEHENNKRSIDTAAKKQGVECAFADRITVRKSADVGVLSCGVGEVCMEDSTSTMGGRCDVLVPDNDEAAALEPQRELHEECEKCMGDDACRGVVDQSGIGCGSCIGLYSCAYLPSDVTIGDNSCVGEMACDSASVNVGDDSCHGLYVCYKVSGDNVPSNACVGDGFCTGQYKAAPVTSSPTAAPVTSPPSAAPIVSCPLMAAKVKVQSLTGHPIQMREVRVYSSGINVAIGKNATQSSDLDSSLDASKALDSSWGSWSSTSPWSSTGTDTCSGWWEVDLGESLPVEKVIIVNRKCNDSANCSCKLSHAAIVLFDDQGEVVAIKNTGDTCDKGWIVRRFPASTANCV